MTPQGHYDQRKYEFDPETGEFRTVIFNHAEGRLVDLRSYQDVRTERLQALRTRRVFGIALVLSIAVFLLSMACCQAYLNVQFPPLWLGFAWLGMIIGGASIVVCGLGLLASLVDVATKTLPPAPVPARRNNSDDLERFKKQSALGKARLATEAEVHQALARKTAPPQQPRRFED